MKDGEEIRVFAMKKKIELKESRGALIVSSGDGGIQNGFQAVMGGGEGEVVDAEALWGSGEEEGRKGYFDVCYPNL